jgi:tRNA nucleotidyltransferase (CCA-adding enzyme)
MKNRISYKADIVFKDIYESGGYVYIVGGTIRDYLLHIDNSHDIDVEVYHLTYEQLKQILSRHGYVNTFGKSFAIMQLDSLPGYDFALPRKEKRIGLKHSDFDIIVDKDLSINQAVKRRDITINALMYDYQKDEIIDVVDGINDLNNGIIRMVNPTTFQEDPLRILRIAGFISRFDMTVDKKTKQYCKKMVNDGMLEHLSIERIYEEYKKILMSNHPSVGFEFLKDINALPDYLYNLINCDQRRDYHPEGSVWNHTMLVVDLASQCKEYVDNPEGFMWSCLLHDIGKPLVTTPTGSSPLHNEAGVKVFKDVNMIQNKKLRQYIETMIMYHMHLMNMARHHSSDVKYLRLLGFIDKKISLSDLMFISVCDKLGRGYFAEKQYVEFLDYMNDKISRLGRLALKPIITGKDLIDNGFNDYHLYKELLNKAYDLQLNGMKKDKIIKALRKEVRE